MTSTCELKNYKCLYKIANEQKLLDKNSNQRRRFHYYPTLKTTHTHQFIPKLTMVWKIKAEPKHVKHRQDFIPNESVKSSQLTIKLLVYIA